MLRRDLPFFSDLRDFMAFLEARGQLVRVREPVSVAHEITEIHRRVIQERGPALLFEQALQPDGRASEMPVLVNLFGTVERVAWGLGVQPGSLQSLGEALAELREPRPPQGLTDAWSKLPLARAALSMRPRQTGSEQRTLLTGGSVDLTRLPVQICWPGEPAPLMTWPLVVTRPPDSTCVADYNMGVYRMQVLGRNKAIMRWLAHRGGAHHHHRWRLMGEPMPVAVVIGADPSTMLSAVLPLPETQSELLFSGLLRGRRPRLMRCASVPLLVPADSEIVIEGFVPCDETAPEGPFGDHTGYYNAVEPFPVMHVTAISMRPHPIYLSTFTGRAPDEPSRIGEALNALFVPILKRQFTEVQDAWLPPEACSYRIAVVSIAKRYAGQARRVMLGLWSLLPQFTYTKLLIVVDEDINVRSWDDVMWAVATRSDPSRDLVTINDTPIDYLDFASPRAGLGGKLGIDATNKIGTETEREWGAVLKMDPAVSARVEGIWNKLGLGQVPHRSVTCRPRHG